METFCIVKYCNFENFKIRMRESFSGADMISQNAFLEILAHPQDLDALSPWSVWQR